MECGQDQQERKQDSGAWGQVPVGRVLAWHTQGPGFEPQHCVNLDWNPSASRQEDLEFKTSLGSMRPREEREENERRERD